MPGAAAGATATEDGIRSEDAETAAARELSVGGAGRGISIGAGGAAELGDEGEGCESEIETARLTPGISVAADADEIGGTNSGFGGGGASVCAEVLS